jgi:hypothetical protein
MGELGVNWDTFWNWGKKDEYGIEGICGKKEGPQQRKGGDEALKESGWLQHLHWWRWPKMGKGGEMEVTAAFAPNAPKIEQPKEEEEKEGSFPSKRQFYVCFSANCQLLKMALVKQILVWGDKPKQINVHAQSMNPPKLVGQHKTPRCNLTAGWLAFLPSNFLLPSFSTSNDSWLLDQIQCEIWCPSSASHFHYFCNYFCAHHNPIPSDNISRNLTKEAKIGGLEF